MTAAIAEALLHFLWQGAVLGAVAWCLIRRADSHAGARYALGIGTLVAMLLAPVVTTMWIVGSEAEVGVVGTAASSAASGPAGMLPVSWVLGVWALGVIVCGVRLTGGWLVARRLATQAVRPVTHDIEAIARLVATRLSVTASYRIVESTIVATPMMVGWLKPVVLLPAAAIAGLSPSQLEALLAHEFAHIRRHDYLVNLLQSAIETLLFYHPAVWWVSRQVRDAREHCCDDLVIGVCDRLTYVSALSTVATWRTASPALAAGGGSLRHRVERLLRPQPASSGAVGWLAVIPIALVLLAAMPVSGTNGVVEHSTAALTITAPAITVQDPQRDDVVVTAESVTLTASVEPPAPVSRPALPVVLDFFMPPVQAAAWQASPPPPPPAAHRVIVQGHVNRPGEHTLQPSQMTVSKAIASAGGFSAMAGREIQVRRSNGQGGFEITTVTRTQLANGDDFALLPDDAITVRLDRPVLSDDETVEVRRRTRDVGPGDTVTITVPESPRLSGTWVLQADGALRRQTAVPSAASSDSQSEQQAPTSELVFFVNGEVNEPGQKVWTEGMTVEKAVALAKGMNPRGKLGHILRVVRDAQGNVVKREKISALKPTTEIRPDDELVIVRRWWGE